MKLKWIKTADGWETDSMRVLTKNQDNIVEENYVFYSIQKIDSKTHFISIWKAVMFENKIMEEISYCPAVREGKRRAQEHFDTTIFPLMKQYMEFIKRDE